MGHLIPAGTGLAQYASLDIEVDEVLEPDALEPDENVTEEFSEDVENQ